MYDFRAHILQDGSLRVLRGPVLIPLGSLIVAITAASFFLTAVFTFGIAQPGVPEIQPAVLQAGHDLAPILTPGAVVGGLLALSTTVLTRAGPF
jgi:hypothetical protein